MFLQNPQVTFIAGQEPSEVVCLVNPHHLHLLVRVLHSLDTEWLELLFLFPLLLPWNLLLLEIIAIHCCCAFLVCCLHLGNCHWPWQCSPWLLLHIPYTCPSVWCRLWHLDHLLSVVLPISLLHSNWWHWWRCPFSGILWFLVRGMCTHLSVVKVKYPALLQLLLVFAWSCCIVLRVLCGRRYGLSRNVLNTTSGFLQLSSVTLNLVHLLRPSSPSIRTILVYWISFSTFSPASQSSAFAWKMSHARNWSLHFQSKVGQGSVFVMV